MENGEVNMATVLGRRLRMTSTPPPLPGNATLGPLGLHGMAGAEKSSVAGDDAVLGTRTLLLYPLPFLLPPLPFLLPLFDSILPYGVLVLCIVYSCILRTPYSYTPFLLTTWLESTPKLWLGYTQ